MLSGIPDTGSGIALVLGTRPDIIKLSPLVSLLGERASVVYTGQHYSRSMAHGMMSSVHLPAPKVNLNIGGVPRGLLLGRTVVALSEALAAQQLDSVVVLGDTTSALAGALAANALDLPLVHVEAGLRSFDRRMPEEHNRVLIDHLADLCCAPTAGNRDQLLAEGIDESRIEVTGNTIVEAVTMSLPPPAARLSLVQRHGLTPGGYILATIHRPENVDDVGVLRQLLAELSAIPFPVVLSLHPRTKECIRRSAYDVRKLHILEPLVYPDFLALARESAFLISDSGGVQEEVSVLKKPLIVVRRSTERPEILGTFGTLVPAGPLVSATAIQWLHTLSERNRQLDALASPYGDGSATERIVALVTNGRPTAGRQEKAHHHQGLEPAGLTS